ncbi:MAG TPA: 2-dehydropantoate 2-reductase [Candidatus Methylomirabilis sp.]|jgi:2-dehydropantoate 2-reductase
MRVLVMGSGGVGGYYGALLARAGEEVTFVARGANLAALREGGLQVRSVLGDFAVRPVQATDDPASAGPVDLILFCVKAYDTEAAAPLVRPNVGPETAVISLQNGVEKEEQLARVLGEGAVMGGAAYIFATRVAPGTVEHRGGPRRIIFGELLGGESARGRRIEAVLVRAGVEAELSLDVRVPIWDKFMTICGTAGSTSLTRLPIDEILACPPSRALLEGLMAEVHRLARAQGVGLPEDAPATRMAYLEKLAKGARTSLYHDLVAGRRMELEFLHGTAVRLGRQLGIPTPLCFAVYAALKPYDERARGSNEQ